MRFYICSYCSFWSMDSTQLRVCNFYSQKLDSFQSRYLIIRFWSQIVLYLYSSYFFRLSPPIKCRDYYVGFVMLSSVFFNYAISFLSTALYFRNISLSFSTFCRNYSSDLHFSQAFCSLALEYFLENLLSSLLILSNSSLSSWFYSFNIWHCCQAMTRFWVSSSLESLCCSSYSSACRSCSRVSLSWAWLSTLGLKLVSMLYFRVDFFYFMYNVGLSSYYLLQMKQRQSSLPIFLEQAKNPEVSAYVFKPVTTMTLMDMVKQELSNVLNPKFIAAHRKELQTLHFVLEVGNKFKKWTIIKRLSDLIRLEKLLKQKYLEKVPSFPIREESEINDKNLSQLFEFVTVFLNQLGKNQKIRLQKQFIKFAGNLVTPERNQVRIFGQVELKKRAGGRHNQTYIKRMLNYLTSWLKKFFTVTSQGIYYTASDEDLRIEEMIPFLKGFNLSYGQAKTGYTYGVVINSAHRMLNIDAQDIFNMTYFVYFVHKALNYNNYFYHSILEGAQQQQQEKGSPQIKYEIKNRYQSFAKERKNCDAKYYVDGKDYFADMYDELLKAQKQVFITGWMISPFFCLKRPDPEQETKFDRVLYQIASRRNVKINIIVYEQPKFSFLFIDSEFTKTYLTNLHENIKVLRHPSILLVPFLWSHHQKMVIIDQKVAFIGGLDIGFGRWDDQRHKLTDVEGLEWPGVDYCNFRITDIRKPHESQACTIDREKQPRMPWHDVAVRVAGKSVMDLSRHFVQYWNHASYQLGLDQRQLLMYAGFHQEEVAEIKNNIKQKHQSLKKKKVAKVSSQDDLLKQNTVKNQNVLGKSLDSQNPKHSVYILDQKQIEIDHEEEMQFYAAHLKDETYKQKLLHLRQKIKQKGHIFSSSFRHAVNFEEPILSQKNQETGTKNGRQRHQVLRSASMWSLGLGENQHQRSILEAYAELIFNSKEFIYIENQFFISVENPISRALFERISRAYDKKQKFKVCIVIPAMPGFAGEIYDQSSAVLRTQVHYMYQTICRGGKSLLEQLSFIENIGDYIQFFTLRTHDVLAGTPVTQIVYVHSKLMIVDDEAVLIGSANINDRSLLGLRDSEIAIVIEDEQVVSIKCKRDNSKKNVRKFAHNLRVELYMQHFGLTRQEAQDYLDDNTWNSMIAHADKNQQIYRQIFGIYPDNSMRNYNHILVQAKNKDPSKYGLLKGLIKGNALLFQMNFLDDENLELKASQKQYYVPAFCYT